MMKRGHIILIAGAALLVTGIAISAVWGISFASTLVKDNTMIGKTVINSGKSIDAKTDVNNLDRPITLMLGVDRNGQPALPLLEVSRLKETVTDPSGKIVSDSEFGESFLASFKPEVTGPYTLTITNLGTKPVSISGTFGHVSFIGPDGKPDMNRMMEGGGLGMIVAGGGLATAGVVALIAGAIITAIDSRGKSSASASTSEGGITYRKD